MRRRAGSALGFSLVEVLIAFALLGSLSLLLSQIMNGAFRSQNRMTSALEFSTLAQSIMMGLRSKDACTNAFRLADDATAITFSPAALPVAIPVLRFNSSAVGGGILVVNMAQPALGNGVTLTKMEFSTASLLSTIGTTYDRYLANFHLEASRTGANGQTAPLKWDVLTQINVNRATNRVDSCEPDLPDPPATDVIAFDLGDNSAKWTCNNDLDLENLCGGINGCTVRFKMIHEAYYDRPYYTDYQLYMEQPSMSQNDYIGISGSTLAGYNSSSVWWYTGNPTRYTIVAPWNIIYMLNYNHRYCTTPFSAAHGPALPKYHFSFLLHPNIKAHVTIKKNAY